MDINVHDNKIKVIPKKCSLKITKESVYYIYFCV